VITFTYSDTYIAFIKYINLVLLWDEELQMGSDAKSNCTALLYISATG
jgi:hypothetical protein